VPANTRYRSLALFEWILAQPGLIHFNGELPASLVRIAANAQWSERVDGYRTMLDSALNVQSMCSC